MTQNQGFCRVFFWILALFSVTSFLFVCLSTIRGPNAKQHIDQVSVNRTLTVTINDMTWHELLEEPSSEHFRQTAQNILLKLNSLVNSVDSGALVKNILLVDMWKYDNNIFVEVAIIFLQETENTEKNFEEVLKRFGESLNIQEERSSTVRHRRQVDPHNACGIHKKICEDGSCVFRSWWCNGHPDCPDGSDEDDCSKSTSLQPPGGTTLSESTSQQSPDGTTLSESSSQQSPDGTTQSESASQQPPDGTTLSGSSSQKPPDGTTQSESASQQSPDGTTLSGSTDRTSSSTYESSTSISHREYSTVTVPEYPELSCRDDAFQCDNMACVPRKWVCDNITDCGDWSDESESACNLPPVMNHPDLEKVDMWNVSGYSGIPVVRYKGVWGAICDDYWDENDADVFCRTYFVGLNTTLKGFPRRHYWYHVPFDRPPSRVLDAVDCNGKESNISFCAGPPLGSADCGDSKLAGVLCQPDIDDIRLVNGTNTFQGRVEIFVNGSWATICDSLGWDQKAAQVICRMLNMNGTAYNLTSEYFGNPDSVELIVGGINCTGNENSILECWSGNSGKGVVGDDVTNSRCSTRRAAGVSCGAPGHRCSLSEFMCDENRCLNLTSRCDGVVDCLDNTDEFNCIGRCTGFWCNSESKCLPELYRCNGVVNCMDLSDETGCDRECFSYQFKCKNSLCVFLNDRCNGDEDCGDGSDEENCACTDEERRCDDGRCILTSWFCDGFEDCLDGSDERNCSSCSMNEIPCKDYSCVPALSLCNGTQECPDGSDEINCVSLKSPLVQVATLVVNLKNTTYVVCPRDWTSNASDSICRYLGYGKALQTVMEPTNSENFLSLRKPFNNITDLLSSNRIECSEREAISIKCSHKDCGHAINRPRFSPFIVGGEASLLGSWPWVGLLYYQNVAQCGAVVISEKWILTAAHCVQRRSTSDYKILLGAVNRFTPGENSLFVYVDKIIVHPNFTSSREALPSDIALLRIHTSLTFNFYIQPICLPNTVSVLPLTTTCFTAGFGSAIRSVRVLEGKLREGKLRLASNRSCEEAYGGLISSRDKICAGYASGIITPCNGDSGSPLMCEVGRNQWSLTGIVSIGEPRCPRETVIKSVKPTAFTRVASYIDWIKYIIDLN